MEFGTFMLTFHHCIFILWTIGFHKLTEKSLVEGGVKTKLLGYNFQTLFIREVVMLSHFQSL